MEILKLLSTSLFILAVTVLEISSEGIAKRNEDSIKPPLVVNPIEHLTLNQGSEPTPEHSLTREKRQNNKQPADEKANDVEKPKPPPNFNPLEDLILNQDKNGFKTGSSLSRVKRQYGDSESNSIESEDNSVTSNSYEDDNDDFEGASLKASRRYPYPYPYPIPIFIGGGFGGFGGRGFGGRGFGGGFGGRGFGGRGFGGGFGGRGFGGGFGGRGVGGGFGGGRGGGGGRG